MAHAEKIAISLDKDVLDAAERLRAQTGESRSALFARAVRSLLAREAHEQRVRDYVQGYMETPEEESEAWQEAAAKTLSGQDW